MRFCSPDSESIPAAGNGIKFPFIWLLARQYNGIGALESVWGKCQFVEGVSMSPIEFEQVLKVQPFVPVRLHMSNGRTHELRHPDNAIVGDEVVAIGVFEEGRDRPLIRLLSLLNINEIEPLSLAN
jgi:hypothetical protein